MTLQIAPIQRSVTQLQTGRIFLRFLRVAWRHWTGHESKLHLWHHGGVIDPRREARVELQFDKGPALGPVPF